MCDRGERSVQPVKTMLKILLLIGAYVLNGYIFSIVYVTGVALVYLFIGVFTLPLSIIIYPILSTAVFRLVLRKSKLIVLTGSWALLNILTSLMLIQEIGYGWSEERSLLYASWLISILVTSLYGVLTYRKDIKKGAYSDGSEEN